jgi:FAD/FMN-containing dehydrogenase
MTTVPTAASIGAAVQAALAEDFQGHLLGPEDSGYHEARRAWNWLIDRYPLLIARCVGTADVVQAVKQARRHRVPV